MEVKVLKDILDTNDAIAAANAKQFKDNGVAVLNFMSSPGAGKTTLVIKTLEAMKEAGIPLAVIDGDIASSVDADRVAAFGVPAVQINTGGLCHLDANMIRNGLDQVDLASIKLLIIENVATWFVRPSSSWASTRRLCCYRSPRATTNRTSIR
jgi:hydrogenase nickel incorporation protein HypB